VKPTAHILIVDDAPTNLRALIELLSPTYEIRVAVNGEEALAAVMSDEPLDLILLDIMMPGMDGYAVCRELKRHPNHCDTPVIFITAKDAVSDETYGFEVGAVDYITKPFDGRVVLARVRNQLLVRSALVHEREMLANQRQFIAMLAHELRTPLAIIDSTAQRIAMKLEESLPEQIPKIEKIRHAVARQLNLLENCLAEERMASTDMVSRLEAVDLRELIAEFYDEKTSLASLRVRIAAPDDQVMVLCDRHLFNIILSNLIDNALKYSPGDRPVYIRLRPEAEPGSVAIEVIDEGSGVHAHDSERIFERYYRSPGQSAVPGVGLGLHLARKLARRQGGDVVLAPPQEGVGAVFILTLPRADTYSPPLV